MNQNELLARQQVLLARGHALRRQLTLDAAALKPPAALGAGLAWLERHPLLSLGAVAALVWWRPRGALRCATRAWSVWQTCQRLIRS